MKKFVKILLLCFVSASFSVSSSAWDDTGHKLSAYIAWQQMSPETRTKVIDILLKAPEDSDLSVYYNSFGSRSDASKKLDLFMIAATWGDIIKNRDFKVRYEKYNHSDWHYSDIFWKQENGKAEILENFPEESGKAVSKLYDFEKMMRDDSVSKAEKAVAIAWFMHIGGDLHNPLHNASRVNETEPKGDQGGNLFLLTPKNAPRRTNLHSFWDSVFRREMPRKNDACDTDYMSEIGDEIIEKYPYSKEKSRLELGNYKQWNMEGFELLATDVYTSDLKREETPSEKYQQNALKVGQEQIALAGYRLGETLNSIFSEKTENKDAAAKIECQIIQKVLYPISPKQTPDQKMRTALLNICPANKGAVARPMTTITINGEPTNFEYDVIRVFETETEAKKYAEENGMKNFKFVIK